MSQTHRVRRATVDDLENLRVLWQAMHFPMEGLERHVTEFQLAESDTEGICGALGLEVSGRQGRVHGEAFLDFAGADEMRELLWQRLQMVAANRGVARFWTEETAPFWRQRGFEPAEEGTLKRLPEGWVRDSARWLTLQAWDEEAVDKSLTTELARFKEAERVRTEKAFRRGRVLKFIASVLAVILAIFVGLFTLRLLQNHLDEPAPLAWCNSAALRMPPLPGPLNCCWDVVSSSQGGRYGGVRPRG